jgi:hypoxanthine phosphoribosyltransferase
MIRYKIRELVDYIDQNKIEALFFLDKSARPLAQLTRDLWRTRHQGEPTLPIRFINIGPRQFYYDDDAKEPSLNFNQIRTASSYKLLKRGRNDLANKKILVIDEDSRTGKSVKEAARILGKMVDSAEVYGYNVVHQADSLDHNLGNSLFQWFRLNHHERDYDKDVPDERFFPLPVYEPEFIHPENRYLLATHDPRQVLSKGIVKKKEELDDLVAVTKISDRRLPDWPLMHEIRADFHAREKYARAFYHEYMNGLRKLVFPATAEG